LQAWNQSLIFHLVADKKESPTKRAKREKFMKSSPWIVSVSGLLLLASALTADADHVKIAKKPAAADLQAAAAPQAHKCPKDQGDMEQGFVLDVRPIGVSGGGYDPEPAEWVQGPIKGGMFAGLKIKTRRRIDAFRCASCGYIELYAQ
jgi:hypothetical protein